MIHLLFGADRYRLHEAVQTIRGSHDGDSAGASTVVLDGARLSPGELRAATSTAPLLGDGRLVIVEGLLAAIGSAKRGRRGKKADADDPLLPWRRVATELDAEMPESTTLVLVEGDLPRRHAGLAIFSPIAEVQEFPRITPDEVAPWIRRASKQRSVTLTEPAVRALATMVGADLWTLSNELDKLASYSGGESIGEDVVSEMVSSSRDTRVWELTDAIVAGDERAALKAFGRLLADGEPAPLLASIIAGQFRRVMLVKDMRERRVARTEMVQVVDPQYRREYLLDRAGRLAARYSWGQLREVYARMLEADLSVKRGLQDDESALQLMVHDLCSIAGARSPARR